MNTSLLGGIPHDELEPGIRKHTGDALTIVADSYPKELKAFQKLLRELKTMYTIDTTKNISDMDTQEFVSLINTSLAQIVKKYGISTSSSLCILDNDGSICLDKDLIQSIEHYPIFDFQLTTLLGQLEYILNTFNTLITKEKTIQSINQTQEELLRLNIERSIIDKKEKYHR